MWKINYQIIRQVLNKKKNVVRVLFDTKQTFNLWACYNLITHLCTNTFPNEFKLRVDLFMAAAASSMIYLINDLFNWVFTKFLLSVDNLLIVWHNLLIAFYFPALWGACFSLSRFCFFGGQILCRRPWKQLSQLTSRIFPFNAAQRRLVAAG